MDAFERTKNLAMAIDDMRDLERELADHPEQWRIRQHRTSLEETYVCVMAILDTSTPRVGAESGSNED